MTETQAPGADWIQTWIEQQREQLRRMASDATSASAQSMQDVVHRWVDLGHAYLHGLAEFSRSQQPDAQSAASARLNEEFLNSMQGAWAGANAAGREAAQRLSEALSRMPPLGLLREHTEAWRELAAAQSECQALQQALRLELTRMQNDALSLLEQRIRERRQSGAPIAAWRELYDLWVECGERTYAQLAHSDTYSKLQAELGNAMVRLRARQQTIIEHALKQYDLPTRSELNSMHRQLRELREKVATLEAQLAKATQE